MNQTKQQQVVKMFNSCAIVGSNNQLVVTLESLLAIVLATEFIGSGQDNNQYSQYNEPFDGQR